MKLYTQNGRWVGTQADAKRDFGVVTLIDVPTDKLALLDWLNEHSVGEHPDTNRAPWQGGSSYGLDDNNRFAKDDEGHTVVVEKVGGPKTGLTPFELAKQLSLNEMQAIVYRYLMEVDDLLNLPKR
jgi:hypothetical protein